MDFNRPPRLGRSRGFTLIELMVVVVIIGLLAAISVPGVVERLRERRANQAAQEIALVYRTARMRALGHGSAVLVHYDTATGFTAEEALIGSKATPNTCATQPTSSCTDTDWSLATDHSVVDRVSMSRFQEAEVVASVNSPTAGAAVSYLDICFSPRGRTFTRDAAAAALTPMSGVVSVDVNRGANSIHRSVVLTSNGMARVAL